MKTNFKRVLAAVMCVIMLLGALSVGVSAGLYYDYDATTHSVFKSINYTLAPGITASTNYAYASSDGAQIVYYVSTADLSNEEVEVHTTFSDGRIDNTGMAKMTDQVAALEAIYDDPTEEYYTPYFTPVVGINADAFNMTTGQPSGAFVMESVVKSGPNNRAWFGVFADGTAHCGANNADWEAVIAEHGAPMEAVGGFQLIMKNGETVEHADSAYCGASRYPRSLVGVTADNKVVIVGIDGNQAPFSSGATYDECFEIMKEQGCVNAVCLDGGGSATFVQRPEGSDEVVVWNRPSDGSERSVSSGLLFASTTPPSDVFDHASFTVENEFITPGSSVNVSVTGLSPAGTAAQIPEDVTYNVTNGSYADGVFTSDGTVGDAVITMLYEGNEVGSATVHVVVPDAISFAATEMVVPYGKSVQLTINATYNEIYDVSTKASDFNFALSNTAVGTIDDFTFTACEENAAVTNSILTATLVYDTSVSATANISLGKGSEVIYDFEDGLVGPLCFDEPPNTKYNYVWPETEPTVVVNSSTGKVHSGDYALKCTVDFSNSLESGYQKTSLYSTEAMAFENAVRVGMWIYIDDECVGLWARWTLYSVSAFNEDGTVNTWGSGLNSGAMDTTAGGSGVVYSFDEPGWHYLYLDVDTSKYAGIGWKANAAMLQFYISDRDGSAYNYDASNVSNIPSKFTFYIDDITVDYSTAVDDREAPVFGNITYATESMSDAATLNSNTVTGNKLSFATTVADYTGKTNYTGIDASTVKAYIDGVEVESEYTDGKISVSGAELANGKHVIKFAACDKMGNYGYKYGYITVNAAESKSTVKLVPADSSLTYIKFGSIYNMNLVATAIEEVQSVEVDIDLDNNSVWQLDHMVTAEGFEATYSINEDVNVATVTLTRTGKNTETGEATLATLPVRVWELKMGYTYENGTKQGATAFTYAQFRSMKEFWRMSVIANVDRGVLTRVDDSVDTFSGERVFCDTEMWAEDADMIATEAGLAYYNSWDGGHIHTAEAIADKAATCTTSGYTGRTYCEVCSSVVDWGTTVDATGHTYTLVDGILKCECNEILSGGFEDGKTYVDGVALTGWVDSYYYVDGIKVIGIYAVDGVYYNFDENGVSLGVYTGLVEIEGKYYYAKLGILTGGWHDIDGVWYYFLADTLEAANGSVTTEDGITFDFVDGAVQGHVWEDWYVYKRCWYGPAYYANTSKNVPYLRAEIDGYTYFFNNAGCMATGVIVTHDSGALLYQSYDCGTDGKAQPHTGVAEDRFYIDGLQVTGPRLVEDEGVYYYIKATHKVADSCTVQLTDAETLTGMVTVEGKTYYAENGEIVAKGAVQIGDDIYYFGANKYALADGSYYIPASMMNGLLPGGTYTIKDHKIVLKQGIVEENGKLYYYVNNVKQKGAVKVGDDVYYFSAKYYALEDGEYYISADLLNGIYPAGTYTIKDAKIVLKNGIVEQNGKLYWYENNIRVKKGAVEVDGDVYYFGMNYYALADGNYYITADMLNGIYPAGTYMIKDYKIVLKQGIYEENGKLYYYENNKKVKKGAVEVDGEIYYFGMNYYALADGSYYLPSSMLNGLISAGTYEIKDGKVIIKNGLYEENGKLYYYDNNKKVKGAVQIGEDIYYFSAKYYALEDGRYYISADLLNGLLPAGSYNIVDYKIVVE